MKKLTLLLALLLLRTFVYAQDDDGGSVIQSLTPSRLIGKGQVDIKWFNNLFTQTRQLDADEEVQTIDRQTLFASNLEVFFGVGNSKRVALGGILEFRSNTFGGRGAFDVFSFDGESGTARSGLTNIAPSIKFVPIGSVANFSVQTSFFFSTIGDENDAQDVFLDQDSFTIQNRFFYDLALGSKDWQLFFDLNTEINLGEAPGGVSEDGGSVGSFANNSVRIIPAVFLSYFPSSKFTVNVNVQHFQLISLTDFETVTQAGQIELRSGFEQNLTSIGTGVKYQLTDKLNIEGLVSYFVRGGGAFSGLGEAYNIGLRYVL